MRRNYSAHLRQQRLKRRHLQVASSAMVRHDAPMAALRPHTKTYDPDSRARLGIAVARAREAAGHLYRPSFAKAAGISVASLLKLETGKPVGPSVYEAVSRALPNWTEDTPRVILEHGQIPQPATETEPHEAEPAPTSEDLTERIDRFVEATQRLVMEEKRLAKMREEVYREGEELRAIFGETSITVHREAG
ncbi:hypothetical protein [Saccharopolyspora antimicrobica]|uniref:hypothetical protein n=1 Tax=Saccharopolyspora antimicrobica TaxID=455193 RepID=UPI001160CF2C|nr:hypothetical protein [Saccharopolyspora antimicrobica]